MTRSAVCQMKDNRLAKIVPWLVISTVALFPVGRTAEFPLILLALIGLKEFYKNIKNNDWNDASRYFAVFFLCLWLPIIVSVPDSYKLSKTSSLAIEYLRFFLAGLAVLRYCATPDSHKLIGRGCVLILSFWILDAFIQLFRGADLFGYVNIPQRLNGVFGHKYKLGLFLSAFAPFFLVLFHLRKRLVITTLLNLLCFIVILLAGSRGGWIMYGVTLLGFLAYTWRHNLKMLILSVGIMAVCLMVVASVLYYKSENFADRMNTSLAIFKGDEKSIDRAISMRLPIWKTAVAMIEAHPVNGVGARAFRFAYPEYAPKDDIFVGPDEDNPDSQTGAYHSHQMQLEVLSETGLVGGVSFLFAMTVLIRFWYNRSKSEKPVMLPYALGLLAVFFPLNTHYALYSSAWAQTMYWFITLYFAAGVRQQPSPAQ